VAYQISSPARLSEIEQQQLCVLAATVQARDGQPPLSDQALTRLTSVAVEHVLARDGAVGAADIVGYAQRDGATLEVLAASATALQAVLDEAEHGAPDDLQIWSHGHTSPVATALAQRGYQRVRVLHQLRRPLTKAPAQRPPAGGVSLRAFVPGLDEAAWLQVNAVAFAHHPEQGRWGLADLQAREAQPWFDPAGLFLAERDHAVIGFHWTKVHSDGAGEVYVLAVAPSAQGLGLGATLLARGLLHLYDRGCRTVLLYVDESNVTAMRLYEAAGFTRHDADVQWQRTELAR
jgi:mycothiol synthase